MELCDVLRGLDYEILQHGKKPLDILGITIDSRTVKDGFVFVCISGLKDDGHNFILQAVENGATVAVVERRDTEMTNNHNITVVYVESTRAALNTLAANFYENPAKRMRIIGVTGTKGKTSVTFFLETVLRECGYTVGVIGTSGARLGDVNIDIPYLTATTPDTIELQAIFAEMAKRGANYVVMEVSSHSLALDKVGSINFAAGIFTNLTQDHLDFHGTMENYLSAKVKLFDQCAVGLVNIDDEAYEFIRDYADGKTNLYTYGIRENGVGERVGEKAEKPGFWADSIENSIEGVSFDLHSIDGTVSRFRLAIPGRFSVYNALSAISTAVALKMPMDKIINGVANIRTVPGRFQLIPNDRGFRVIVDYAHSPDSITKIIETVREFTAERVITVFGCGGDRDRSKRPIMGRIAGELSDICVITSDNPRNEPPAGIIDEIEPGLTAVGCEYYKITDREEAIIKAISIAKPGDSVIIAGKGYENYQEFENKRRIHFDDSEVAVGILNDLK